MQATREKAATTNTRATDYLFTWKMGGSWPHEALGALVNKFESVGVAEEEWTCLAHKRIRPGDRAYLLKQGKPPRGIFGRGHVVRNPHSETVPPQKSKWLVELRFDADQGDMLCDPAERLLITWEQLLRVEPKGQWELEPSGISLDAKSARELDDIIDSLREDPVEAAIDVAEQTRSARQGFRVSPTVRKAIEEHAVEIARAHYVGKGYSVRIVGKPYDLNCRGNGRQIYVEVKGTQTSGEEVLLTPNEVKFARLHKDEMALFVVHGVSVDSETDPPRASGGIARICEPWDVDSGELEPFGYSFRISKKS